MANSLERCDPRMGDESEGEEDQTVHPSAIATPSHQHQDRHVRLDIEPTTLNTAADGKCPDVERRASNPSDETEATQVNRQEKAHNEAEDQSHIRTTGSVSQYVRTLGRKLFQILPFDTDLSWVSNNFTWSKIKPVIRCAAFTWICLLFVVIPKLEVMLGQVGFHPRLRVSTYS